MDQQLELLFREHGGILCTAELKNAGLYYDHIQRLLMQGEIERIRRGYYQLISEQSFSDLPVIVRLFPDAVLCMESALDHYGYTNRTPSAWHLAVPYKSARNRFAIDYPIVKPHFIREDRFTIGITAVETYGTKIQIYDRERTVCDLLLHRNKIDAEVFNTAIQQYIRDPNKTEAHLISYARQLHVEKKVREVVGIWL